MKLLFASSIKSVSSVWENLPTFFSQMEMETFKWEKHNSCWFFPCNVVMINEINFCLSFFFSRFWDSVSNVFLYKFPFVWFFEFFSLFRDMFDECDGDEFMEWQINKLKFNGFDKLMVMGFRIFYYKLQGKKLVKFEEKSLE